MHTVSQSSGERSIQGRNHPKNNRRGSMVVVMAALMIGMIAVLAFAVDIGYIINTRSELQRSVDAAALAGAGAMLDGQDAACSRAVRFLVRNPLASRTVTAFDPTEQAAEVIQAVDPKAFEIAAGNWIADAIDPVTGEKGMLVEPENGQPPSAFRVAFRLDDNPFFFAGIAGNDTFDVTAQSVVTYQPREIILVLDLSGSMNDDSELRHVPSIGHDQVVENLQQIWKELGSPTYGGMQWEPQYIATTNNSAIKGLLGLNGVPYPYPSGSWDSWIDYVKSDSSASYVKRAGYQKKYGYLTLVNYWLEKKPQKTQTPDLWMTSEQPLTAVKDAVDLFLDDVQRVETADRVGLSVYNAPDGDGKLASGLTHDFPQIASLSRSFQAAHYHTDTNIGAGMKKAREELAENGRPATLKMVVLLTDGKANWVNGTYNVSATRQFVLDEAQLAANAHIPVVTISLGAGADRSLMDEVARITGATHFNVPGGQAVSEYAQALQEVFRKIANDRPLKLVK